MPLTCRLPYAGAVNPDRPFFTNHSAVRGESNKKGTAELQCLNHTPESANSRQKPDSPPIPPRLLPRLPRLPRLPDAPLMELPRPMPPPKFIPEPSPPNIPEPP